MPEVLMTSGAVVAGLMLVTWLVSGLVRDASIVDIVWGLGFVLVAWAVLLRFGPAGLRGWLLLLLTTFWGVRLSLYLGWRNIGKGEDFRYRAMRQKHGDGFFWASLGTVFSLQGFLLWLVSLPVQTGVARIQPVHISPARDRIGILAVVGAVLWAIGIFFETVGDYQLARFKADPRSRGRVMDRGLWRYTRHPNYFGDFCVWWGLFLIAADGGHWWTVISPILMSALLIKYSGAGLLERSIVKRRPGYTTYIERTNAFFPGPAKKV